MKNFYSTKWWKIMKFSAAPIMLVTLFCGVTLAHDNYGQLLDKEISVSITNTAFDKALQQVAQAASIKFAYSREQLNVNEKITLVADHKQLRDILDELFLPRGIRYIMHENGKSILLNRIDTGEGDAGDMLFPESQPDIKRALITGTVTDADKQPLAGVNILVRGTTSGTTTDPSGRYSIDADAQDVLVYSFIGFASLEMKVNEQTTINVVLLEDVTGLSEVIVNAGYWEVNVKEKTGSTSRVTAAEIQKQNISNPLQSLQGRMTGVYVQQNTGMPGGGIKVQVRGQNSLRNGNDGGVNGNLPLYLVDGVPFTSASLASPSISGSIAGGNPLSAINPNDIESIDVLKDADATAIYGSRGANGVVLITTKRAKAGKAKVDLDLYHGIGQVSNFMNLLNTPQYLAMRKEAFRNDGITPDEFSAPDILAWDTTRNTDWQKKLIGGTAHVTNGNLSFSGGTQQTQYLLSGGYYRETSVFLGSNAFQRGSGRLSIRHRSADDRFRLEASASYSSSVSDIPSTDFTLLAVTLAPTAPALYDNNGNLNWEGGTWNNPLSALTKKYKNNTENLVTNASVGYEIVKGLNVKSSFGYTTMNVDELSTVPISSYDPQYYSLVTGSSSFGAGNLRTWIIEPQADYTTKIGLGIFSALIGSTFQKSTQKNQSIDAYGYSNDALIENLNAATDIVVSENTYSEYKYGAAFARLNYIWNEKYILNLTGRRDGSSRFGPGNRFANFGAVGAAWIFSNEAWMIDNISFLSFGKLRSSFGVTGSDAIGNYQYLETFSSTTNPYAGSSGLALTRLANPGYSWETNKKLEAGIDLGFLNDRISFSSSFYLNRSSGQLVGLPLPVVTGQSSVQFNLPAIVENKGWEFQLNTVNIKNQNFQWSTGINLTLPSNRLIEFPDLEKFPSYASKYDVGKSVYVFKGYQANGVDPLTGLYKVMDQNSDGVLTSARDYVALKKNTQTAYGGISNSLKYKNVQLDFLFQFVKQKGFNYMRSFEVPGTQSNQPLTVLNRWQAEGDTKSIQKFSAQDPSGEVSTAYYNNVSSDNSVQDASFIRLKNVSLSWQLPSKWMKGIGMDGSRVFVQGQNLLLFSNYIGMDPEVQNSNSLPPLRMLTAGFHISL